MTESEIIQIVEKSEYNPTTIGIEILKQLGFKVETYWDMYSESIYIYDENKNLKYWK